MPPKARDRPASPAAKRKANAHDPAISPPPTKRKIQSTVSKTSVASFFTPVSQRPKSQVSWEERAPADDAPTSLLVATYKPLDQKGGQRRLPGKQKIAAFDLDSTLITTSSGKKHAEGAGDWKWWDRTVPHRLKALHDEGYALVVFSNQGGLKLHPEADAKKPKAGLPRDRVADYKQKCSAVLADLNLPVNLYAATGKDRFRKPRPGMWLEMCKDLGFVVREAGEAEEGGEEGRESERGGDDNKTTTAIDRENSVFVGDAGGRVASMRNSKTVAKDFSCSDRNMAVNLGVAFQTPEEYFLGEAPREFERGFDLDDHPFVATADAAADTVFQAGAADQEMVVFCGPPGAGKSTFYRSHLEPLGFKRVNQDTLKSKDKCLKAAAAFLKDGSSVVIDNTNPDPATRALWVDLAKKHRVPVRCVWFKTSPATCEHNDAVRSLNKSLNPDNREPLPRIAFNGFFSRFREPKATEGFAAVTEVAFAFRGTEEEYALWGRYWL